MNLDFSHFHPMDHHALNPRCARYHGGFRLHVKYWLAYQIDPLWPLHRIRCWRGIHDSVHFYRGGLPEFDPKTLEIVTPPAGYICKWCEHETPA